MQVLAKAALFAVLLLAVRAPGAIDGAVPTTPTPSPETYSTLRLQKPALTSTRISPQGRDIATDEANEGPWNQAQAWHRLLAKHAAEDEEVKTEEEAKNGLQDLRGNLEAMLKYMQSFTQKDISQAASAQVERLRSQRAAILSDVKVPEPLKKLLNDPQIKKDALKIAFGLASMGIISAVWPTPSLSQVSGTILYVSAFLSLLKAVADVTATVASDPEVIASLEKTSAAAREQVKKLLNAGRLQGEKASEYGETD